MDTLKLALFYASQGWQIFPCVPGDKLPMVRWKDEATSDANQITGWWDTQPDANIGLATGSRSGVIALDVDPQHGGEASLRALILRSGELPVTPVSMTGGGGRHFLFAHPGVEIHNSAGKLGPGLDIRGDGGYIVVPPSLHPSGGRYVWNLDTLPSKTPLAPLPAWIISDLMRPEPAERRNNQPAGDAVFVSGGRNTALTSLAGTMRRPGMGETAILNALLAENERRCFPPLDASEVETIVHSVLRYEPAAPIQAEAQPAAPVSAVDGLLDLIGSLNDPTDFIKTGLIGFDRTIGGVARKNLTVIAARPSVGKTTLCWQIARNMAASGKRVLFFSLEMSGLALWRKAAFGIAEVSYSDFMNGDVPPGTIDRLQTEIIPELIDSYSDNLMVYDHGRTTTDIIRQVVSDYAPDVVMIDHLAKVIDRHESEVQRLGLMSHALQDLSKSSNSAVVVIHHLSRAVEMRATHEPQLSDLRDSGHIEQDADVVIMPYRPDYYDIKDQPGRYSETRLLVRKNREGEAGVSIGLYYDKRQQWFYRKEELPQGVV